MSNMHYQFLHHIDAPKRILTLTLDELVIAVVGFMLLAMGDEKILVAVLSFGLLTIFRFLKKGGSPRVLFVLAYWYLPQAVTQFFLPQLPASYQRLWLA